MKQSDKKFLDMTYVDPVYDPAYNYHIIDGEPVLTFSENHIMTLSCKPTDEKPEQSVVMEFNNSKDISKITFTDGEISFKNGEVLKNRWSNSVFKKAEISINIDEEEFVFADCSFERHSVLNITGNVKRIIFERCQFDNIFNIIGGINYQTIECWLGPGSAIYLSVKNTESILKFKEENAPDDMNISKDQSQDDLFGPKSILTALSLVAAASLIKPKQNQVLASHTNKQEKTLPVSAV